MAGEKPEHIDLAQLDPAIGIDFYDRPLYEKNLEEVLKGFNGDPFYRNIDIARRPEETVRENYAIMEGIQGFFQTLSNMTGTDYNNLIRVLTIHGESRYYHSIGNEIEEWFNTRQTDIFNRTSLNGVPQCNLNLEECVNDHTSFGLDKGISGVLGRHARMGCIPKYKLVTLCHCYSLATYPGIEQSNWHPIIATNIEKFESKQQERMGRS
jgi:hypothetical protein